jgi:hypothetical protein
MTVLKLRTLADQSFRRFKVFIYGPPKTGKTFLLRDLVELAGGDQSKVLLVIQDEGQASLLDLKDIPVYQIGVDGSAADLLKALQDPTFSKQFEFVFIDGVDEIAREHFDNIVPDRTKNGEEDAFSVWRKFGEWARGWVYPLTKIEPSVVFVAHSQEMDPKKSQYMVRPSWPGGGTRDALCGWFDYFFYMMPEKPSHPSLKDKKDQNGKPVWPAVFVTNSNLNQGGDPRYECGQRTHLESEPIPGRMHASLVTLWKTLFPDKKAE